MKLLSILSACLLLSACSGSIPNAEVSRQSGAVSLPVTASSQPLDAFFLPPLSRAADRMLKKPFGISITPSSSPVQPERFTGYHTGLDFETFPKEQSVDVPVSSVCSGTVLFTGWVSGYGGVFVQSCSFRGQLVTVLYGHLNVSTISLRKGERVSSGQEIALLGRGYSHETDGERKHLHLAIHRGSTIDFRGYVPRSSALDQWINPALAFGFGN